MPTRIRHILVAVHDLRHAPRAQLRKAGSLAKAAGATVELFHAIDEPDPGASWPETATAEFVTRRRAAIVARSLRTLERLAREPAFRGVRVRCMASWDYPPHEAIVRRALASRAGLVIAATRHHVPGARLLLRNTDWELIRHCPTPLLLVKSSRDYRRPAILAAVDPFHAHARPADLDARLLAAGETCAQLLHGKLHVFHAYMPLINVAMGSISTAPMLTIPPELEDAHGAQIASTIERLAASAGVPRGRRHVHMGDVAGELAAAAHDARAGVVVMGAVSRSALKRLFIGNAAERVLDDLECDVLVIKPRGFKSTLSRRPAVGAPIQAVAA
jgi:universal stress protein E